MSLTETIEGELEEVGRGFEHELAEMVAEPGSLATDRLEHQIVSQAAQLSAATCRWLLLVAEYDRREAYGEWECRSMAHWLEWKCQLASNTAREHVRVARALVDLPVVREVFGRGELSYSKVRAVTRVATVDTEAELVDLAREMTGSQLDRTMRAVEKAARQITDADLHEKYGKRSLDRYEDDDGDPYWILRPSVEEDAMLRKAVEYVRDRDYVEAKAEARTLDVPGESESGEQGRSRSKLPPRRGAKLPQIDALMRAIEWGLTRAVEYDDDELPSERYQVTIHVNGSPKVGTDGLVHLDSGVRLHPSTAQRLGCNATVRLLDEDGKELNKGRRMRTFTRRQKRVLARRQPTCGFPHCDMPARWCDAHHYLHWIKGGTTDLSNAVYLCKMHHHAVHEGGWRLFTDAAGMIIAVGPDGRRVTRSFATQPPAPGRMNLDLYNRLSLHAEPNLHPNYERADMRFIIDTLIQNWESDYLKRKRAAEEIENAAAAIPGGYPTPSGSPDQPLLN